MRRFLSAVLLTLPASALAQGDCFPPDDSNEAKVFAVFAVPFAFGPAESPAATRPWGLRLALEASYIPNIDDETATPTICRPGKGPENTDFVAVLPRPRAQLGLPRGFLLEVGWVPPISVNEAKPHLLGLALGKVLAFGTDGPSVSLRLHATIGQIRAPITCDNGALKDPQSECFNGTKSEDRYRPNAFGADLAGAWSIKDGRVRPFVGAGINLLRPRFQVHFVNQLGQLDDRRVEVDLERLVLFAGASWFPTARWGVTGQVYAAPADAVTGRIAISYGR